MRKLPKQIKKFRIVWTSSELDKETKEFYTDYNIDFETNRIRKVDKLLSKSFKQTGFKIYYTRIIFFTDNLYLQYDYGSHSCFIELHFLNKKVQDKYIERMTNQREANKNA